MAFCNPAVLRHSTQSTQSLAAHNRNVRRLPNLCPVPVSTPTMLHHTGRQAPDFSKGWTPDNDPGYVEVRVLSICTHGGRDGALVTLAPVGGRRAFRMAVTRTAAEAIRIAAARANVERPGALELAHAALAAAGAVVVRAAITHVRADVFIARVWTRSAVDVHHHDARPSDALVLALRAAAPLYLNTALLAEWSVAVDDIVRDARAGRCELVRVHASASSASALRAEVAAAPEHVALAKLRAALDMAVRLERFSEAARLRDAIAAICPADKLEADLRRALEAQNFAEASRIRDLIVLWKARQRRWERGGEEASIFGSALSDIIEKATQADAPDRLGWNLYGSDYKNPPSDIKKPTDENNERLNMDRSQW